MVKKCYPNWLFVYHYTFIFQSNHTIKFTLRKAMHDWQVRQRSLVYRMSVFFSFIKSRRWLFMWISVRTEFSNRKWKCSQCDNLIRTLNASIYFNRFSQVKFLWNNNKYRNKCNASGSVARNRYRIKSNENFDCLCALVWARSCVSAQKISKVSIKNHQTYVSRWSVYTHWVLIISRVSTLMDG